MKQNRGFTLVELLIIIAFITLATLTISIVDRVIRGNFWYSSGGVLKQIQVTEPEAVDINVGQRNIFRKSILTVKMKDGSHKKFLLDSCIMFNYTIAPAP